MGIVANGPGQNLLITIFILQVQYCNTYNVNVFLGYAFVYKIVPWLEVLAGLTIKVAKLYVYCYNCNIHYVILLW